MELRQGLMGQKGETIPGHLPSGQGGQRGLGPIDPSFEAQALSEEPPPLPTLFSTLSETVQGASHPVESLGSLA
jgi:hypothetical protein